MKYLLILLALIPHVWAAEFQNIAEAKERSISSKVINAIEDFKKQIPCGFPDYGIPPLAPFKRAYQEIEIDYEGIQIHGEIRNFTLVGLNNFDIVNLRVNALLRRINFEFNWHNVYFTTDYNLSTRFASNRSRAGPATFSLRNVTAWGVIKYNMGVISGKVSLKEFSVYISLGEVKSEIDGLSKISIINKKLNRIIELSVMMIVNENTENVAEFTNDTLKPIINDILYSMSISEILGILGGGGSGDGESNENEPCIPPEDFVLI